MTGPSARLEETHTSLVLFVGERVYKLRKPVHFAFLDFRSRADREEDCHREVVLNSRLAPTAYLGVADIVLGGIPLDHAVVMRRFPDDRNLAAMATRGEALGEALGRVAAVLATFHRDALRSAAIDAEATAERLRARWQENFDEVEPFVGPLLDAETEGSIRRLVSRWIEGRHGLLRARIAQGCICDGHGDLQAADIFCVDEGVQILDCLEFSDRLRYGDVAADVAFLAMDLERLGRGGAAAQLVLSYQAATGRTIPVSLLHHYQASRAYVRAKVACLRRSQGVEEARSEAMALQALTLDHLRRGAVTMVLVGGLPGSGKSTLARDLAAACSWTVLRSDEVRRQLVPSPGDEGENRRYAGAGKTAVYREMLRRGRALLEMGDSVVLDASWIDEGHRAQARVLAAETSSELVEVLCEVDDATAADRIARRRSQGSDPSEATAAVRDAMRRSMAAWSSATVIDTAGDDPAQARARALSLLGARGPHGGVT